MRSPRRVVVVDDDPAIRRVITRGLARAGLDATEVPSASELLARAAVERFDAIVSDHAMPDLDGVELLARLRALLGDDMPRFGIVTGSPDAVPRDLPDLDFVLSKPCPPEAIAREVKRSLAESGEGAQGSRVRTRSPSARATQRPPASARATTKKR